MKRQRTQHYLRKNHGTMVPSNIMILATAPEEIADPERPREYLQRLGLAVAHRTRITPAGQSHWEKVCCDQGRDFWDWAVQWNRPKHSAWIVGYGIAQSFTLVDGWRLLDNGYFSLDPLKRGKRQTTEAELGELEAGGGLYVDGDPPVIMLLHSEVGSWHIVDIRNYGEVMLEHLAEAAGQQLPPRPKPGASFEEWERFLSVQCAVVREWFVRLVQWWRGNDLGTWRHTIASLAMSAYRHRWMNERILIHNCEEALQLERDALAGGEFRCYRVGNVRSEALEAKYARKRRNLDKLPLMVGPVVEWDCNGLYPWAMRNHLMPVELAAWKDQGTMDDLLSWRKHLCVIARVTVETDDNTYPCWLEGERWWSVGKFTCTLCGPELDRAIDSGHVVAVHEIACYYRANLFKGFVDHWQAQVRCHQDAGDAIGVSWCKLIQKALSGKWAQKEPRFQPVEWPAQPGSGFQHWSEVMPDGLIKEFRQIGGWVQVRTDDEEGLESSPAIAAFITSYARDWMRQARHAIGQHQLVYQGLDSLFILDRPALTWFADKWDQPTELGKFRKKGLYETAEFRGPSDYTVDGVHVVAGVNLAEAVELDGVLAERRQPSLRTITSREPGGVLRIKEVRTEFGRYHPRGILEKDGRVNPPQIIEGAVCLDHSHPLTIPDDPRHTRTAGRPAS